MHPDPALVERFRGDLDALIAPDARIGVAISGGPDSLALLLLAAAARPGLVEVATVDHDLRSESAAEAHAVGQTCARLGVPHAILTVEWRELPTSNIQAEAREARYAKLASWALDNQLAAVATAHHADDQAETLLMRLARGSGVAGLGGIRRWAPLGMRGERGQQHAIIIRPLLGWRRLELEAIVRSAGLEPADDPSNRDPRFDRTRARRLLTDNPWLDPARLAATSKNCAEADAALRFIARREYAERSSSDGTSLDASALPYELQRRLLAEAIEVLTGENPPGPDLVRALDTLLDGGTTTLAGLKLEGGPTWRLTTAPPRRPLP
ncbi:MAG TPA: tRNA lysidine(34) synthetase TilS [Sphingomicrobium sp.]|nr:tRNA lysidine(34) synthetase TilS [Sphingomicrobium sp.]